MRQVPGARHPNLSATGIAHVARFAVVAVAVASIACGHAKPPPERPPAPGPAPAPVAEAPRPPSFGAWEKTSFGDMMWRDDVPDAFDLVFHFHIGKPADAEYRAIGLPVVIATATHGLFAKAYGDAYEDPARFRQSVDEITAHVRERTGRPSMHPARIALIAWSAGYGAVRKVLGQSVSADPATGVPLDSIDTVILLDGLHTAYRWGPGRKKRVDLRDLQAFIDFAKLAADGKKLMVATHSQIEPGSYASTTETTAALISMVNAPVTQGGVAAAGLEPTSRADKNDFHVLGYAGDTKEAHVAQLHLVGMVLHDYLLPRWNKSPPSTATAQ